MHDGAIYIAPSNAARLLGEAPSHLYMRAQRGTMEMEEVPTPKQMVPLSELIRLMSESKNPKLRKVGRKLDEFEDKVNGTPGTPAELEKLVREILGTDYKDYKARQRGVGK